MERHLGDRHLRRGTEADRSSEYFAIQSDVGRVGLAQFDPMHLEGRIRTRMRLTSVEKT